MAGIKGETSSSESNTGGFNTDFLALAKTMNNIQAIEKNAAAFQAIDFSDWGGSVFDQASSKAIDPNIFSTYGQQGSAGLNLGGVTAASTQPQFSTSPTAGGNPPPKTTDWGAVKSGFDTFGVVAKGIGDLGGLYVGIENMRTARKSLSFQKKAYAQESARAKQQYNTELERQREVSSRITGTYSETAMSEYMDKHGLK